MVNTASHQRELSDEAIDSLDQMLDAVESAESGNKQEKVAALSLIRHYFETTPDLDGTEIATLVREQVNLVTGIEEEATLDGILTTTRGKVMDTLTAPDKKKMMMELMRDVENYDPEHDPASLALRNLLTGKSEEEVAGLIAFLHNPNSKLENEVQQLALSSEADLKNRIAKEQKIIDDLGTKADITKGSIETFRVSISAGQRSSAGNVAALIQELEGDGQKPGKNQEYAEILRDKKDAERRMENLKIALGSKNQSLRYNSTRHLLGMAMFYFNQSSSEIDVDRKTQVAINDARNTLYTPDESGFSFLKPTLTGTLKNMAKEDSILGRIGLEELGKLADMKDRTKVKVWLEGLEKTEGHDMEYHMTESVPRLIAYLELALRDGGGTDINSLSKKATTDLLDKLQTLRREYAMKKAKEKVTGDMSRPARMKLYLDEMSRLQAAEGEINQEIIQKWGKRSAKKIGKGTLGAVGVAGKYTGLGIWMTMKGLWKTGKWMYGLKGETKKNVALTGVRAGAAGGLAWGASALGAASLGLGMAPLALAAIPGVFAPEIIKAAWQNKGKIAMAGVGVAGFAALTGWRGLKIGVGGPLNLSSRYRNWAFS